MEGIGTKPLGTLLCTDIPGTAEVTASIKWITTVWTGADGKKQFIPFADLDETQARLWKQREQILVLESLLASARQQAG